MTINPPMLRGIRRLLPHAIAAVGFAGSALAQGNARPSVSPADSLQILKSIVQHEERFLKEWRNAWLASDLDQWNDQQKRFSRAGNPRQSARILNGRYCGQWGGLPRSVDPSVRVSRLIPSRMSRFNGLTCPGWLVDEPPYPDASVFQDSALTADRRQRIATLRDTLILAIKEASERLRGDTWLTGQHVRFLVDQAYSDPTYFRRALEVASNCIGDKWWCNSLRGFVYARASQLDSAEIAFNEATRLANDSVRCSTDNILTLLDPITVPVGMQLPRTCGDHRTFADRYWWLADPVWGDSINERRIEHNTRTVSLLLAATLPKSETFDWKGADTPSDAVAQLAIRYGWPSRMFWSGHVQSRHAPPPAPQTPSNLIEYIPGKAPVELAPSPPFTTQEYSFGRLHFGPSWTAVADPLRASSSDWEVAPPDLNRTREWWPTEHMRRARVRLDIDLAATAMATRRFGASCRCHTGPGRGSSTRSMEYADHDRDSGRPIIVADSPMIDS